MKKKYISPKISERALMFENHLLLSSGKRAISALGRESNTWEDDWDDEEETEDLHGWFQ